MKGIVGRGGPGTAAWGGGNLPSCPNFWFRCYRCGERQRGDAAELPEAGWGPPPPVQLCSDPRRPSLHPAPPPPSHIPPELRPLSCCFSPEDFNLLPGPGLFSGTSNLSPLPTTLGDPLNGKDQRVVAPRQLVKDRLRMLCLRSISDYRDRRLVGTLAACSAFEKKHSWSSRWKGLSFSPSVVSDSL